MPYLISVTCRFLRLCSASAFFTMITVETINRIWFEVIEATIIFFKVFCTTIAFIVCPTFRSAICSIWIKKNELTLILDKYHFVKVLSSYELGMNNSMRISDTFQTHFRLISTENRQNIAARSPIFPCSFCVLTPSQPWCFPF